MMSFIVLMVVVVTVGAGIIFGCYLLAGQDRYRVIVKKSNVVDSQIGNRRYD